MQDIGQFNLVLGDNNVGKTSLLEALMFDGSIDQFILSLSKRLDKRNIGGTLTDGVWGFYVNNDAKLDTEKILTEIESNIANRALLFDKVLKKIYLKPEDGVWDLLDMMEGDKMDKKPFEIENPKGYTWPVDFIEPLVSNLDRHEFGLTKTYSKLVRESHKNLRKEFIASLQIIDSSIEDLREDSISTNQNLISVESGKFGSTTLLAMYGDGTITMFRNFLMLNLYRGKKMMFDEIDAGIYYNRMKDYWKVILKSAHENDVQIFASTHNEECITAFEKALAELGEEYLKDARTITLKERHETNEVIAYTNKIDVLQFAVESGNDLR